MDDDVPYIHCVDCNIFVNLTWHYPIDTFEGLWDSIAVTAKEGRIIVPERIVKEYDHKPTNTLLKTWLRKNKMVRRFNKNLDLSLKRLINELPQFVDHSKPDPVEGDQHLVALAMCEQKRLQGTLLSGKVAVVTCESPRKLNSGRWKIPDACAHYGIECFGFMEWLKKERWKWELREGDELPLYSVRPQSSPVLHP